MTSVTLQLQPETEQKLRERAGHAGKSLELYLEQLVECEARSGAPKNIGNQTFDQILAPMRQGFTESGVSDDELDSLFEEALGEARRERRNQI